MALDRQYFDAIEIETVRNKFYYANRVNAVLEDIRAQAVALNEENERLRTQALALNEENERLRVQAKELEDRRAELSEALLSAQTAARQIVERAQRKADDILREAEERKRAASDEAVRQHALREAEERKKAASDEAIQQHALRTVEKCLFALRQRELETLDIINGSWQEFLSGLMPEDGEITAPPAPDFPRREEVESWINAIAREMNEIGKP